MTEHEDRTRELPIPERPGAHDDRFVGHAGVPVPVTAVPYNTEQYATGQYTAPQPPPRKRSGLMVAAVVVIVLIVCAVGSVVGLSLTRDLFATSPLVPTTASSPPPPPSPTPKKDTPSQVADKFLAAAVAGDQSIVQANLCTLLRGNGNANSGSQFGWMNNLVGYKLGEENVNGLTSSVGVTLTLPILGSILFDLYLITEPDGWKVCGAGPA
jgi:hypothetical protein